MLQFSFAELDKNRIAKTTTDLDLQKFRKIDTETVQKISTIAARRRSSLDLADLNLMSKEVTAAKEARSKNSVRKVLPPHSVSSS